MTESDGDRVVQCTTARLEIRANPATITFTVHDDKGLRQQLVAWLAKYSEEELEAMIDGKPITARLGLSVIRDDRNGESEPLTEEQVQYHIKTIIDARRRKEASNRYSTNTLLVLLGLLVAVLALNKL